jgi:sugar/nucleoside kinase (ribokinase family)
LTPDLVVLGNLLVDDIVFEDGRTRMAEAGGAVLHAAAAGVLWVRVGVASVRGPDYPQDALDGLAARGVDLSAVEARPRGVRTWLLYEGERRRLIHRLDVPTHTEASPASVPARWRDARAFHLAPMPFDVQRTLVAQLADARGIVSVDPHDPLTPGSLEAWRPVIAGADVLWLGREELDLGREDDPLPTLRGLAGGRLRYVLWKRGARGGWLYDVAADALRPWAARAGTVADPTGAGDAFAAGFVAGLLYGDDAPRALERALVSASFAMEGWGARALLAAKPAHAARRMAEWFPR